MRKRRSMGDLADLAFGQRTLAGNASASATSYRGRSRSRARSSSAVPRRPAAEQRSLVSGTRSEGGLTRRGSATRRVARSIGLCLVPGAVAQRRIVGSFSAMATSSPSIFLRGADGRHERRHQRPLSRRRASPSRGVRRKRSSRTLEGELLSLVQVRQRARSDVHDVPPHAAHDRHPLSPHSLRNERARPSVDSTDGRSVAFVARPGLSRQPLARPVHPI